MGVLETFERWQPEIARWRRDLHQHPELMFDVPRTAALVAQRLREFGCDEVVEGIGRSGVVGLIRGRGAGTRVIGLRADMDALPIEETTNLPYASKTPGQMHACGHDGHTAMLLGAARYLCEQRDFSGAVALIFQPAEEGGGGGRLMVEDGLMERFAIEQVFGMHNMPGVPLGQFALRPGPLMAATDEFDVDIEGRGGHAALPHQAVDATVVGAQIVLAAQSIVARNVDPMQAAVVSVTTFHTQSSAYNVLPHTARLTGTVRTLEGAVRELCEQRLRALVEQTAAAHGARATLRYRRGYPVTRNSAEQTAFAAETARTVAGAAGVDSEAPPVMGGEDFSYMLEARPGAFIFVGNGDSEALHHPGYDFNDAVIPSGCSYWVALVQRAQPL